MPHSGRIIKVKIEILDSFNINELIEKIRENLGEEKAEEFKEAVESKDKDKIPTVFKPVINSPFNFNIVYFEKYLNRDYYSTPYYKPPIILSSALAYTYGGGEVTFYIDKVKVGYVANVNMEIHGNETLSEGDIINIRTERNPYRTRDNFNISISFNATILIDLEIR